MPTLTVENYVKAIYQLSQARGGEPATTGELARVLEVSPGSVTSMLRTLADSGLASYRAYEGVRLTEAGQSIALRVVRRHRLVELFLSQTLGMTWDEVHEEAEHLEHAVSDRLVDRIEAYLDYPDRDPHGDPIPKSDGSFVAQECEPLCDFEEGSQFVLERVTDQSPDFLRYLSGAGLHVGAAGSVLENNPHAGAIVVQAPDRRVTLGREHAARVLVRRP